MLSGLLERAHRAPKKIQVLIANDASSVRPAAAVLAVEREDSVGFVRVADVEFVLDPLPTKDELVPTAHPRNFIVQGKGVVVEMSNRVGAAANGDFAFGNLQTVGHGLINIDP